MTMVSFHTWGLSSLTMSILSSSSKVPYVGRSSSRFISGSSTTISIRAAYGAGFRFKKKVRDKWRYVMAPAYHLTESNFDLGQNARWGWNANNGADAGARAKETVGSSRLVKCRAITWCGREQEEMRKSMLSQILLPEARERCMMLFFICFFFSHET